MLVELKLSNDDQAGCEPSPPLRAVSRFSDDPGWGRGRPGLLAIAVINENLIVLDHRHSYDEAPCGWELPLSGHSSL